MQIILNVFLRFLLFPAHLGVEAKCTHSSKRYNVIDSDFAACFVKKNGGCPHNFEKIDGDFCDQVHDQNRVCCLIKPTFNVEVKYNPLTVMEL